MVCLHIPPQPPPPRLGKLSASALHERRSATRNAQRQLSSGSVRVGSAAEFLHAPDTRARCAEAGARCPRCSARRAGRAGAVCSRALTHIPARLEFSGRGIALTQVTVLYVSVSVTCNVTPVSAPRRRCRGPRGIRTIPIPRRAGPAENPVSYLVLPYYGGFRAECSHLRRARGWLAHLTRPPGTGSLRRGSQPQHTRNTLLCFDVLLTCTKYTKCQRPQRCAWRGICLAHSPLAGRRPHLRLGGGHVGGAGDAAQR